MAAELNREVRKKAGLTIEARGAGEGRKGRGAEDAEKPEKPEKPERRGRG